MRGTNGWSRPRASCVGQAVAFMLSVAGAVAVVGGAYLALKWNAVRILRTPDLKVLVLPVELFAQPADLYEAILLQPVEGNRRDVQEFTIHHKYLGGYLCGLALANSGSSVEDREPALRSLQLEIALDAPGLSWSLQTKAPFGAFSSKEAAGVHVALYSVPRDAPLDAPVRFRIRFLAGGADVQQRFGPLRVYIARTSDR